MNCKIKGSSLFNNFIILDNCHSNKKHRTWVLLHGLQNEFNFQSLKFQKSDIS